MSSPQQPELARSRKVASLAPDAAETLLTGQKEPGDAGRIGDIPEDNMPGHHPEVEQDKPDPEAFLAKMRQQEPRPVELAEAEAAAAAETGRDTDDAADDDRSAADDSALVKLAGLGPRLAGDALKAVRKRL